MRGSVERPSQSSKNQNSLVSRLFARSSVSASPRSPPSPPIPLSPFPSFARVSPSGGWYDLAGLIFCIGSRVGSDAKLSPICVYRERVCTLL